MLYFIDAENTHLKAADALIAEVAGQDEAWIDHIEQDQDAGGFEPAIAPAPALSV